MNKLFFVLVLLFTSLGGVAQKSWRQTFPNGGYCDYVMNEDGSCTTTTVNPCIWCRGAKTCTICFGTGGYMSPYGFWVTCSACLGTNVCKNCQGKGFTTLVARIQNGVGIGYDQNGRMYIGGGGSSSGGSSSGGSGSSGRHSGSGRCSRCGGTGVDPTSNSGGSLQSWVAYYNPSGTHCRYCGSYTEHFHDRCSSCNVPRY